jgi:hypothetical protein
MELSTSLNGPQRIPYVSYETQGSKGVNIFIYAGRARRRAAAPPVAGAERVLSPLCGAVMKSLGLAPRPQVLPMPASCHSGSIKRKARIGLVPWPQVLPGYASCRSGSIKRKALGLRPGRKCFLCQLPLWFYKTEGIGLVPWPQGSASYASCRSGSAYKTEGIGLVPWPQVLPIPAAALVL